MQIVTFVLFVNALIIGGVAAALAYALRLWPLHERGVKDESDPGRERRGAWLALGLCALIAGYSTSVCVRIEHYNELSGGLLPKEYHPRGWRWSGDDERIFRLEHRIYGEHPLTRAEREDYSEWRQGVENRNTLHRTVEEALRLYILVPLGLAWLICLALGRRVPVAARVLSISCALCLLGCGNVVISRGVYTALMGD